MSLSECQKRGDLGGEVLEKGVENREVGSSGEVLLYSLPDKSHMILNSFSLNQTCLIGL